MAVPDEATDDENEEMHELEWYRGKGFSWGSWSGGKRYNKILKTGWLNKCCALITAVEQQNWARLRDLVDMSLGFAYEQWFSPVACYFIGFVCFVCLASWL